MLLAVIILVSICVTACAVGGSSYFSDVPRTAWYAQYTDLCYENGLIKGVGNSRFNPDGIMTVAEMLTVCARLHHLLSGGDGNIPQLPPEGPRGLVYFTDLSGIRIACFDDLWQWGTDVLLFDDEARHMREGSDAPEKMILVSLIDGEKRFECTYFVDDDGLGKYRVGIPQGHDVGVGLADEMIYISWMSKDYIGEWYESAWWYLQSGVIFSGLTQETETALDEMSEIIERDYPEMNTSVLSDVANNECPRVMLALFLAVCIP